MTPAASDRRSETPDDPRIPADTSFFKISVAAKIVGVPPYTLRFWEREFPWVQPVRTTGKQRLLRREDLALFLQIKRLRDAGVSLGAIRVELRARYGRALRRRQRSIDAATPTPPKDDPTLRALLNEEAALTHRLRVVRAEITAHLHGHSTLEPSGL